jgi:uncharacterized protein (DUF1499 family)
MTLAVAAFAMTVLAGPGTRMEIWSWAVGLMLLRYGAMVGIAAGVGSLILLAMMVSSRWRAQPWVAVAALVIAAAAAAPPMFMVQKARSLPLIHDVSTDLADPPKFVSLVPARKASPNGVDHGGKKVADLQAQGYPDIKPVVLPSSPAETLQRATEAARSLGWEIVATDAAAGRLEATATTAWWGFKDDVVVRIRPEGNGSRVDVRSASRVGLSDLGANAKRIREFVARLA